MSSLIFLLYLAAMAIAWSGRRNAAMLGFAVAVGVSAFWLRHHITDALALGF